MLRVMPNVSSDDEYDDVFIDSLSTNTMNKKLCVSKHHNTKTSCESYFITEKIHPLEDLNMSLDSSDFKEPYKRRGSAATAEKRRPSGAAKSGSYVTFAEVLSHFQNQDPNKIQKILSEQDAKKGNGKILGIFSPHPKLPLQLETERDILLLMAETKYDRSEPIHLLILQSIYSRVMGGPLTCPALGIHWVDIGFNHSDPAIDLSSAKMLGAISLLFFVTQYSTLAEEAFRLSTSTYQAFPFALVGLNFTRAIVRLVRKETLNRHLIRQKRLIYIVMDLYCAVWFKFHTIWKRNDPNVQDLNTITTSLEHDIMVKPLPLLSQFKKGIKRSTSNGTPSGYKLSFIKRGLKLSSSSSNVRVQS